MRIRSFLLFSVLAIFSSCNKYKNVQEPEYRDIRNIHLINLGPLQSTAGVDLIYYNPNNFGVQLAEARGDIYIDNNYFGQSNGVYTLRLKQNIVPDTFHIIINKLNNNQPVFFSQLIIKRS